MNDCKEIKHYIKNNELDLEKIINEYSSYIATIINNMAKDNLNNEDKEEIISEVFFILWKNMNKLNINKYLSSYIAGITRNVVKEYLRKIKVNFDISDYENSLYSYDKIDLLDNSIEEISKIEKKLENMKEIETNKVESTKAKLMIVKMNADAYDRINDKDKYYEAMQTPNYPNEERNYYKVDDKIRKAWVVVLNYENNYGEDIVKRYTEGSYSYFVDATTGEIIGGHTLDYIYSASR